MFEILRFNRAAKPASRTLSFAVGISENQETLPMLYWLPKLHKQPYKSRFIANSGSCTTAELSKLLTSCLTAIKNSLIKYCDPCYERDGINRFWSIKNSNEVLNKLNSKGFKASTLSTYDFSTLYTTLPHHLIKDKLIDLIEHMFSRQKAIHLACNDQRAFFTSDVYKNYNLWSCQKVCEALFIFWIIFLLDLELNFTDKLWVFRCVLTVLLLLQICSYFVMREIS